VHGAALSYAGAFAGQQEGREDDFTVDAREALAAVDPAFDRYRRFGRRYNIV
jgi:hypothetical protein